MKGQKGSRMVSIIQFQPELSPSESLWAFLLHRPPIPTTPQLPTPLALDRVLDQVLVHPPVGLGPPSSPLQVEMFCSPSPCPSSSSFHC